jgi:hypothetical protein
VLPSIAAVFVARACAAAWLVPRFPGNSAAFWRVSSGTCWVLGTLYGLGSLGIWSRW